MQPLVSIILATYNRPETLRLAIASVLEQTLTDWELLVIGDACGAETAAVVEAAADPRIHYINLIRNVGEQSGPNNVGIARARGRHIAFLNHDDLWLPDHLQAALEWLQATGADLVFPATAVIMPCTAEQLAAHTWRTYVHGIGRDGERQGGVDAAGGLHDGPVAGQPATDGVGDPVDSFLDGGHITFLLR